MKLATFALVVVALGLPINDLVRYGLLVIATVLIAVGTVSVRPRRWLAALAVVAICVLGQILMAPPRIEEGHNVFLVDRAGGALETGLPRDAFRLMAAEFDARYPPERRCDPAKFGCWRGQGFPDQAFAFSADGSYRAPGLFAAGDRDRFRRSGMAAPRLHQRAALQLECATQRRRPRVA